MLMRMFYFDRGFWSGSAVEGCLTIVCSQTFSIDDRRSDGERCCCERREQFIETTKLTERERERWSLSSCAVFAHFFARSRLSKAAMIPLRWKIFKSLSFIEIMSSSKLPLRIMYSCCNSLKPRTTYSSSSFPFEMHTGSDDSMVSITRIERSTYHRKEYRAEYCSDRRICTIDAHKPNRCKG